MGFRGLPGGVWVWVWDVVWVFEGTLNAKAKKKLKSSKVPRECRNREDLFDAVFYGLRARGVGGIVHTSSASSSASSEPEMEASSSPGSELEASAAGRAVHAVAIVGAGTL